MDNSYVTMSREEVESAAKAERGRRRRSAGLAILGGAFVVALSLAVLLFATKRSTEVEPHSFKGDQLGTTLDAFKAKHRQPQSGRSDAAPFCSDYAPQVDDPLLYYRATDRNAGVVHASLSHPVRDASGSQKDPTVAGIQTTSCIYKFVDGRLYQITMAFSHDGYSQVLKALTAKYGTPSQADTHVYKNLFGAELEGNVLVWENAVSEVVLFERTDDMTESLLIYHHKPLGQLVDQRTPTPGGNDL